MRAFYKPYLQNLDDALALSITRAVMAGYDRIEVIIDGILYFLVWDDVDDTQPELLVIGLRLEKHEK